ncbi:MAG: hypothetical protein IIA49_00765 [Bacteroidetes bacterium]|nr:hypothetical protein [Bacteroidota bacterium]MCH7769544.1 hypothetical protein [Bacteroidota bacterium]
MKSKSLLFVFVISLVIFSSKIFAQGPPIFTDSPLLLGLEGGGIRTFGKYISTESGQTYIQPLVIPYNVTTDFQIGGIQPYVFRSPDNGESQSGFGNFTLFGKYSIIQIDGRAKTFRALLKYTQTFTTGASNVSVDANASQFSIVTGYITINYGIYGTVGYTFVSNDLPDNLIYNFAFGYPVLPQKYPPFQLNLFLELNGTHTLDVNKHLLFVSPGLQLMTSSTFLIETGVQIPVIDDRNNTKFVYTLGIRYLFF